MTNSPVSVERRIGQRFAFNLPVSLRDVATATEGLGFTQDLSSRGAFLFTDMALNEGAEVELVLLRDAVNDVRLDGEVEDASAERVFVADVHRRRVRYGRHAIGQRGCQSLSARVSPQGVRPFRLCGRPAPFGKTSGVLSPWR